MRLAPAALALLLVSAPPLAGQSRRSMDFDGGWKFRLGDVPAAREADFDDAGWRALDLPHDWSIEGPFSETNPAGAEGASLPGGIGWYRKAFTLTTIDPARLVFLDFDGVYRNSEVWLNGHYLGKRPYGYSSFRYELTPYLNGGDAANVVAVRVDNAQQPNSRWYSGSGIYRHVRLVVTDSVHVAHWGTYITTPEVDARSALVRVRTTLVNAMSRSRPVTLRTVIYDSAGSEVAAAATDVAIPADSTAEVEQELRVGEPRLWSTQRPYLYRAVSWIDCGDRLCDETATPLGIRTFSFDPQRGFILNGERVKIRGVCLHHDLGALGAALSDRALERQLEIMREMGANAIRTSHNPPAPELLDLADRMGFIVMDEAFDMWRMPKRKYDYHLDWDAWHERDLTDMVLRDRNHPSVFIWSIGNEIPEQGDTSGIAIARELVGVVHRLDPTRPATAGNDHPDTHNFIIGSGALDLVGVNYHHAMWGEFPRTFPGQRLIVTEATSSLNTRGHYDQPSDSIARYGGPWMEDPGPPPNADYRLSSYDNRAAAWGSLHEESLRASEEQDFVAGMFIWTGFDYLGEPTPYGWPARSSYFGIVDLAGFPKDAYWLYQSQWTDRPVLHLFPHWNWAPGDTVDVWAYTNADEVELLLNGRSLGAKRMEGDALHLMWRVPWAPGVLRAIGREGGHVIATDEVRTAGEPVTIVLAPDRAAIEADGKDLSFITITVVDSAGVTVPIADATIHLGVDGPAKLAAVDNGDQISHAPFQADSVRLFNGKALAIVQALKTAGEVRVTATSEGLKRAEARIEVRERR